MPGIGQLNEKPLHASLREWYSLPGDEFEVEVDGYVIDIVREDLLLEIQTANLAAMKTKLKNLTRTHPVRVIYPIAQEKWIVKLPKKSGDKPTRRKSPKRGCVDDLFWELVSFPQLLANPNFSMELLLIGEEEVRKHEEGRSWRRRGWVTHERRLLDVRDRRVYDDLACWKEFLPESLTEFTARELADDRGIPTHLAQRIVYCLRAAGVIKMIGKRGRAYMYRPADSCTNNQDCTGSTK